MQFWDGIYIPLHCFQNPALCKLAAIRAQKEALQNLCQPTCAKGMIHTSCFTRNSAGPVISWCQSQTKTKRLSTSGSQGNKNDIFPKQKSISPKIAWSTTPGRGWLPSHESKILKLKGFAKVLAHSKVLRLAVQMAKLSVQRTIISLFGNLPSWSLTVRPGKMLLGRRSFSGEGNFSQASC